MLLKHSESFININPFDGVNVFVKKTVYLIVIVIFKHKLDLFKDNKPKCAYNYFFNIFNFKNMNCPTFKTGSTNVKGQLLFCFS